MKITEVNTYTVRPRWGFVEIVTDEGFTGWGEPVLEGHCSTVLACVQEMKPYLIGQDPMRIEDFSAVLYRAVTTCVCTAGSVAIAPAMWALPLWNARTPALPPSR